MIHILTRTTTTPAQELRMDCASCNAKGITATAADVTAREYLYGVIPVSTSHWATITCGACGRSFRSPLPCDQLATMTADQISILVATRGMSFVGNITKFCITMSILLGVVPMFGLGCALVGVFGTRKSRSRWRTAAFVGLAITIIVNVIFVVMLCNDKSP